MKAAMLWITKNSLKFGIFTSNPTVFLLIRNFILTMNMESSFGCKARNASINDFLLMDP